MHKLICTALVLVAGAWTFPIAAHDLGGEGNARAGRELAVNECSECHVVVPRRLTPRRLDPPPDFVEIANSRGMTAKALSVFLHTPHPTMPNLVLSDQESANVIAYFLSLAKPKRP